MVISEEGESLGLMNSTDALELAYDKGLDLVLIAPQATPPVAKIMDYGRYRFEREKKKKEAKQTDMFHLPQDDLIEELQNLDVLSVTPMDALNILFRLREKARQL